MMNNQIAPPDEINKEKEIILIVDDMALNIQLMASFLKNHYEIKVATNGEKCLELAHNKPAPDLILLDIEMPDMNGYEVCQLLKENPETTAIPVIFVTGKVADDDEEYGLKLGAVDYITKPIRPAIVLARVETHLTIKRQQDQLKRMALHDQLTGIYNRHYLMETAQLKVARSLRHQFELSLAVIDIDYFKLVNDKHGHMVGDKVLIAVAELLDKSTRKEDLVARFGGEEFVLILDHCSVKQAVERLEIIRQTIEKRLPEGIQITASFGVAELTKDEKLSDLIKRADLALYRAKSNGRNRIETAG